MQLHSKGPSALIHSACLQNKRQDVIITIDIRKVLSGPDVNGNTVPPRAECDDSDFEDWTSGDETGEPLCILGSTHSFYRMKATQADQGCFLKKDYVFKPAETKVPPVADSVTRACVLPMRSS